MTKEQEEALKLIKDSMNKKCNGLECKVIKNNIALRLEKIQLNKQIDLMADFIDKTGAGRRVFSCAFRKNDECNENGCRYCIKQYFKEIAEQSSSIN